MTQEHRDQFLAMEGWQKTDRGYLRKDGFQYSEDTGAVRVTHMTQRSRKFRRLPFGRQFKHDALVGWFVTDAKIRSGGLRELNEMANRDAKNDGKDSERHVGKFDWILDGWLYHNKRQGWKTINVDGEKTVVEVVV